MKIYSAHINSFSAVFKTQNVSQVAKLQQKRNIALTTCRQIQKKEKILLYYFVKPWLLDRISSLNHHAVRITPVEMSIDFQSCGIDVHMFQIDV